MLCGITCGSTAASLENNLVNKVTPQMIEDEVISEHYYTARHGRDGALAAGEYVGRERPEDGDADLVELGLITHCVLIRQNGFKVTGESACVDPGNFDAEIGCKVARENAIQKIWPLLGYELKTKLGPAK